MLKKMLVSLFITVAGANAFAAAATDAATTVQTLPWSIKNGAVWHIANPTGTTNVTFRVSKYITGRPGVLSDPIRLVCGGTYVVQPGGSVNCRLTSFVQGDFQITSLANGSEGSYTVS